MPAGDPVEQKELVREPWDGEHCNDCGKPYADVYWLPDAWWAAIRPYPARPLAGTLCPDCALVRLLEVHRD